MASGFRALQRSSQKAKEPFKELSKKSLGDSSMHVSFYIRGLIGAKKIGKGLLTPIILDSGASGFQRAASGMVSRFF